MGISLHVCFQLCKAHPSVSLNLKRVRRYGPVVRPAEHVDVLILDEITYLRAVFHDKQRSKPRPKAHFVLQASHRRRQRALPGPWMTATGIRPESS